MAYGYQNIFAPISASNPHEAYLSTRERNQDIIGKELSNVIQRIKGQHEEERLKGEIAHTKAQTGLTNKQTQWYDKEALAKIAYQQAHGNLMGLQGKEIEAGLPYIQMLKEADAKQKKLEAQKAEMIMGIINNRLNPQNQQPVTMQGQMPPIEPGTMQPGSQGMSQQNMPGIMGQPQVQSLQQNNQLMSNRAIDELVGKFLGMPTHQPHYSPQGEEFYINPLTGQTEVTQVGRTPESVTLGTELTKQNVKALEDNYATYMSSVSQKPNLQIMLNMLEDPQLQQVVGPFWKNSAAKYFGNDKAKELQATFNTASKGIIQESAKSFGSRFTNQEMNWLQQILPNDKDTFAAIKGKVTTLEALRRAIEQKTSLKDSLIRDHGLNPVIADKLADEQVDLKQIKNELKPHVSFKSPDGDIFDIPKSRKDLIEKYKNEPGFIEWEF